MNGKNLQLKMALKWHWRAVETIKFKWSIFQNMASPFWVRHDWLPFSYVWVMVLSGSVDMAFKVFKEGLGSAVGNAVSRKPLVKPFNGASVAESQLAQSHAFLGVAWLRHFGSTQENCNWLFYSRILCGDGWDYWVCIAAWLISISKSVSFLSSTDVDL